MKRLNLVGLLLIVGLLLGTVGCKWGKEKFPVDLDPGKQLVGRVFELKMDFYVFTWRNYQPPHPLFGVHRLPSGLGIPQLPERVSGDHVGEKIENYQIIGLLEKDVRFRVTGVRRVSPVDNRYDIYEVELLDALHPDFPTLDAFWITDPRAGKPKSPRGFAEEYVREVK